MRANPSGLTLALIGTLATAGCGDSTAPVTPKSLTIAAGDTQTGQVATELPAALEVLVSGSDGRPMNGVSVAWAVSAGGGTLNATATTTDGNGRAGVRLTLGQKAELHQVTAGSSGLATLTFSATAVAGPPATIDLTSGADQLGTVGVALAQPVSVRLKDVYGNPVSAIEVTFTADGGGTFNPAEPSTDAQGTAQSLWTLGRTAGDQTASVSVGSASSLRVGVKAKAAAAAAASIEAAGGGDQTGTVGAALPQPISVRVRDAYGNPVPAAAVAFSTASGGSLDPSQGSTDANGLGSATWTLGTTAGAQAASAKLGTTAASVSFQATAKPGPPKTVEAVSGDDQIASAGTTLPTPLTARVKDAYGNVVPAATVSFTTADGGSLSPAQVTTGADGLAVSTWKLGPLAAMQEVLTSVSGGVQAKFRGIGTHAGPGLLEGAYEYRGAYPDPKRQSFVLGGETVELVAFPGQLVTFLKPGTAVSDATALIKSAGGSVLARIPKTGFFFVAVPVGSEQAYINAAGTSSTVVSVVPHSPEEDRRDDRTGDLPTGSATPGSAASGLRVIVIDRCGGASSHGTSVVASYIEQAGGGSVICLDTRQASETLFRLQEAAAKYEGERLLVNISLGPKVGANETFEHWQSRQAKHIEGILNALRVLEGAAENIGITYAAGNDGYPLSGALDKVRKKPGYADLLEKHMLIVGRRDASDANYANSDEVFVKMAKGTCPGGGDGTSCAAPRALAVLQKVLEEVDVSVTDAVLAAQTSANSNASFELVEEEAISRAELVKEAGGDDRAAAKAVTLITFTGRGATTSGVVAPVVAGVSVSATVSGTDGFYMSALLRTNASGSVSFQIPPGDPGVVDTITLMVVLTGLKNRTTWTWGSTSPEPPAAGSSSRVRRR